MSVGLNDLQDAFNGATAEMQLVSPQGYPVFSVILGKDSTPMTGEWLTYDTQDANGNPIKRVKPDDNGNPCGEAIPPVIDDSDKAQILPCMVKFRNPESPDAIRAREALGFYGVGHPKNAKDDFSEWEVRELTFAASVIEFKNMYWNNGKKVVPLVADEKGEVALKFIKQMIQFNDHATIFLHNSKNFGGWGLANG